MDKTSKKIIKYLKKQPDYMIFYSDTNFEFLGISEDEFYLGVRYLASNNMVDYISNQDDIHIGIQLTHETVHQKEINRSENLHSFLTWLFHSYLGGVVTGVTGTLLSKFLVSHGLQLFDKLCSLLKYR